MSYRVVYGARMPTWEKPFSTLEEAEPFARRQRCFGDVIFSIAKVIPGEGPQSIMAALDVDGK